MSKLTITASAKKKITQKISGPAKLLLSYDDGVGPYSKVGSCAIGTAFDIIAVQPGEKTPDYNAELSSDLGPFYYKKYSARYLDTGLKLDLNPQYQLISLSGTGGIIDGNVRIIDYRR